MIKKIIHYSFIIGLILFLTILVRLDFRETGRIIISMQISYIFIGLLFTIAEILFKTQKLQEVVKIFQPISFYNSLKIYLIGIAYGVITPGKVGDLVKLYTLRQKTGLAGTDCLAIGLIERLLEMIALVGLAIIGVILLIGYLPEQQFITLIVAIILIFVLMFVLLNQRLMHALLRPIFYLIIPESSRVKPRNFFYDIYGIIRKIIGEKWVMSYSLFLSILGWIAGSIRAYFYAQGLGIHELYFISSLFFIPLVTVIELIPISILGIGTRDYALVTLLTFLSESPNLVVEQAVSLSLVFLILGPIPPAIIGYIFALREHISWKNIGSPMENNEDKK